MEGIGILARMWVRFMHLITLLVAFASTFGACAIIAMFPKPTSIMDPLALGLLGLLLLGFFATWRWHEANLKS